MRKTIEERFSEKYLEMPWGCWEWQGKTRQGYGMFKVKGKDYRAHRISIAWAENNLDLLTQPNKMVMHSCNNRSCVNPKHLSIGTAKENAIHMMISGRGPTSLTDKDVLLIRSKEGLLTREQLAKMFNVTYYIIACIHRRSTFKHLTDNRPIFRAIRNRKYSDADIRLMRSYAGLIPKEEIQEEFNISHSHLWKMLNGSAGSHIPLPSHLKYQA